MPSLAQAAISETFRTNTLTNSWSFNGTPCLTVAGSATPPSCTTTSPNYQDANGNGWLRLTTSAAGRSNAIFLTPFPVTSGFDLTFTYAMYGGTTPPGDGIAVFLIDPTVPGAGSGGQSGGGLGYCYITGGILGIGLDAFGNFTTPNLACGSTGPAVQRSNVSVRAGANATPAWGYLTGTGIIPTSTLTTNSGWSYPAGGVCAGGSCVRTGQRIHMSFYPDTTCGANEYRILVESITNGTTIANLCVDTVSLGTLPETVELGFAGGSAAATQYQEIRDLGVGGVADLSITKSDGQTAYFSGESLTYTIVATNNGPSPADGATFADPAVAGLNVSSVTCANAGGAACPTAANLTVAAMQSGIAIPTLPAGGSVTFTVTATVAAGATGNLSNVASITPSATGAANSGVSCTAAGSVYTASTGTCTATDTDTPPTVSITKTANPTTVLASGDPVVYTVVVTNTSTVPANNVLVSDPLPTGIASAAWSCQGTNGATCPDANGNLPLNETIPTLPAGGVVTYKIDATASASPPSPLINTATANGPNLLCSPSGLPAPCNATVTNSAAPVIQVVKTANPTTALQAGGKVIYTVVVTNNGTAAGNGISVSDPLPAGIASATWTCSDSSGGTLCPHPNGASLPLGETVASLPTGASVTYTITAIVASPVPAAGISNTATATGTGVVCQNGSASPCSSNTVTNSPASSPVSSDMQATGTPVNATVGTPVTVTTICINNGPDAAQNATCVVTGAPAGATTTCTPIPPVTSLAANSSIVCTTTFTPTDITPLNIITTAGSDTPDPTPTNNTDTVTITPTPSVPPVPAPLLDKLALAALAMLLAAGGAAVRMRRNSARR